MLLPIVVQKAVYFSPKCGCGITAQIRQGKGILGAAAHVDNNELSEVWQRVSGDGTRDS